jgi:hypothetical protein
MKHPNILLGVLCMVLAILGLKQLRSKHNDVVVPNVVNVVEDSLISGRVFYTQHAKAPDEYVIPRTYANAQRLAINTHRMLMVLFYDQDLPDWHIEPTVNYVCIQLTRAEKDQYDNPLINHPAFGALNGQEGIVVVDYKDKTNSTYGYTVSAMPVASNRHYHGISIDTLCKLPSGTLTQRSLIYAMRAHHETPKSANGVPDTGLTVKATEHSLAMAKYQQQNHDGFMQRVAPPASEIVAQSSLGEGLMEAASDCVRSWRESPGHWGEAKKSHRQFGYDMKLGRNGLWYACGIFRD